MTSSELIVVIGATGIQGGSVARTFLTNPGWRVRGITRDVTSSKAQTLQSIGVEMVQADLNDATSLKQHFVDAHALFVVTDFWTPFMNSKNHAQAREAGITINQWAVSRNPMIFSTLSSAKHWSKGKYTWVYHFDSKADAVTYLKQEHPDLFSRTSFLQIGAYLANFLPQASNTELAPKRQDDGTYEVSANLSPEAKIPLITTDEDTGPLVESLIEVPAGLTLLGYRELLSINEFLQLWSKVTRNTVKYKQITFEEKMKSVGELGGREAAETLAYIDEFGYEGRADTSVIHPKDLATPPRLSNVEEWISKQSWS